MLLKVLCATLAVVGATLGQRAGEDLERDGPDRQLFYLNPLADFPFAQQQRFQGPPATLGDQNVLFLQNGLGKQGQAGPTYLTQNGLLYVNPDLRDDAPPSQPGYIESIYNWILGRPQTQPPTTPAPGQEAPETPTPPAQPEGSPSNPDPQQPETEQPEDGDDIQDIEEQNDSRYKKPLKSVRQPSRIEQLEPDAELIPQNGQPAKQPLPQGALGGNGFIPGQRFYILNPQPQYYGSNPLIYNQIPGSYRPQTPLQVNPAYQQPYYLYNGQQQQLLQTNEIPKDQRRSQAQPPPAGPQNAIYLGPRSGVPLNVQSLTIPSGGVFPQQQANENAYNSRVQSPVYQHPLASLAYTQTPGAALPLFGIGRELNLEEAERSAPQQLLQYGIGQNEYPQFLVAQAQAGIPSGSVNREFSGGNSDNDRSDQPGNFLIRADSGESTEDTEDTKKDGASSKTKEPATTIGDNANASKQDLKTGPSSVLPLRPDASAPRKVKEPRNV